MERDRKGGRRKKKCALVTRLLYFLFPSFSAKTFPSKMMRDELRSRSMMELKKEKGDGDEERRKKRRKEKCSRWDFEGRDS